MIRRVERSIGYYAGSHWFQVGVLFALVGVFALWLLEELEEARERVDQQVVEMTVRSMRTGMQFAVGEALLHQNRRKIVADWAGTNPVIWLAAPPHGYRGECSVAESRMMPSRSWCFERESRHLVYRTGKTVYRWQVSDSIGCEDLRWQVVGSTNGPASEMAGLRIEMVKPCGLVPK
jgi:hypothetical protein